MILNHAHSNVQTEGFESQECGIEKNATMFRILSSSLYSDRQAAVLREICCNAYDAQIEAGRPNEPIHVTLPTYIKPMLTVTDNGPGLSKEDIFDLYTTMFKSNKRGTNDQTGGFGLGSKSPLSYADSFTVTSRHGHTENVYAIFKDEDGTPKVGLLESRAYVGPTGLSVQVPCSGTDNYRFEAHARSILAFFNPIPDINEEVVAPTYLIQTPEYSLMDGFNKDFSGANVARVLVGNVTYPINKTFGEEYGDTPNSNQLYSIMHAPFIIHVPIGSVDIAPSREELSYDKRTTALIHSRLKWIFEHFTDDATKAIAAEPTPWAQLVLYCKIKELTPITMSIGNMPMYSKLNNFIYTVRNAENNGITFKTPIEQIEGKRTARVTRTYLHGAHSYVTTNGLPRAIFYIVRDYTIPEVTALLNVEGQKSFSAHDIFIFVNGFDEHLETFLAFIEGAPIIDWDMDIAPDLLPVPEATKAKRKTTPKNPQTYYIWTSGCMIPFTNDRKAKRDAIADTEYVIFTDRNKIYFAPPAVNNGQPPDDIHTYLAIRNQWARHFDVAGITRALCIPMSMRHCRMNVKTVNDVEHLFKYTLQNKEFQRLWVSRQTMVADDTIRQTLDLMDSIQVGNLVEEMNEEYGPCLLTDTYRRSKDQFKELRRFNRLCHEFFSEFPELEKTVPTFHIAPMEQIYELITLRDTYRDVFSVTDGYSHSNISLKNRKHYYDLIHSIHNQKAI